MPVAIGSDFMQSHECGISSAKFFALHELMPFSEGDARAWLSRRYFG